jgi:3-oxoacyl-[acyl-carrier protein] reductase
VADTAVDGVLQSRIAVLTGASGGIGNALALRLAESGTDLLLTYGGHAEETEHLAEQVRKLGRRAEVLQADFADAATPALVVDVDEQLWDHTMAVNVRGPFFLAKRVLPGMIERGFGRILLFSSIAAFNGGVIGPHYSSSKAALHGLTHYLAVAWPRQA